MLDICNIKLEGVKIDTIVFTYIDVRNVYSYKDYFVLFLYIFIIFSSIQHLVLFNL